MKPHPKFGTGRGAGGVAWAISKTSLVGKTARMDASLMMRFQNTTINLASVPLTTNTAMLLLHSCNLIFYWRAKSCKKLKYNQI